MPFIFPGKDSKQKAYSKSVDREKNDFKPLRIISLGRLTFQEAQIIAQQHNTKWKASTLFVCYYGRLYLRTGGHSFGKFEGFSILRNVKIGNSGIAIPSIFVCYLNLKKNYKILSPFKN